jgi:hypothetical protein
MGSKRQRLALVIDNGPVLATRKKARAKKYKFARQRPVTVHYPWGYTGSFASVKNAITRATRHVMDGNIKRCNIEVDGFIVADVTQGINRVLVQWVDGWVENDFD